MARLSYDDLCDIADQCELELHGCADASSSAVDAARLAAWQAHGFAGEMRFMERDPALLSDPRRLVPNARTVIVFGIRYSAEPAPPAAVGFGRVARYAWGLDYHTVLRERLLAFSGELRRRCGEGVFCRVFSDAVPLLERSFGVRGGLGFVGKNTLLIAPRVGSYFFLAEVITDVEVDRGALSIVDGECGSCDRCIASCPTGAIVSPHRLDARRCISYLTIEKRSALTPLERRSIGEWIFGCDVCQDVCPFNHAPRREGRPAGLPEFGSEMGVGPLLRLDDVLSIGSEGEFRRRFGRTALARARRKGLVRNAAIVAANTGAVASAPLLARLVHGDQSPLVRQHCLWSLWVLESEFSAGCVDMRKVVERALGDPDADVRSEALAIQEGVV